MDAQWHGMLRRARRLVGTTVQVAAKPTHPTFCLPVYEGPNIKRKVVVIEPLEPGTDFQCVEVCESADFKRICGRIEGLGWVNLAHRGSLVDDERPVWYIVPHWQQQLVRRLPLKGCKGGGSGKGNTHGKGRKGRKQ